MTKDKGIRIAKYIANAGYCSRREAEELIKEGVVLVNGKEVDSPATFITDHSVKINGKLLNPNQEIRLWILHKPKGIITTSKDPENRKTIFDLLPKNMPRTITVGRLDFNTEGLLLLTTNGELARYMELPKNKWIRKYRARVFGVINKERLKKLENGIKIEGVRYGKIKVEIETKTKESSKNTWLKISIEEGKNREIRKVMQHMGLEVSRLIRTSFGPFNLGSVAAGQVQEVSKSALKNSLPKSLLKK